MSMLAASSSMGTCGTEVEFAFGDDVLASAILDRLLHHCDVISINGPSYRLKEHVDPRGGGAKD